MLLYFSNSFTLSNHCLLDLISEKRLYLAQIWCKGSIAPFVRCLVVDEDSIGYLLSVGDLHVAWHVKAPCHLSANPFSGTVWGRKQRWKWLTQVLPFWTSAEPQARTISISCAFCTRTVISLLSHPAAVLLSPCVFVFAILETFILLTV